MKVNKLKAKITEIGLTQRDLASMMNVNKDTINRKINGVTEFSLSEAKQIGSILGLKPEEMSDIFLNC